MEVCDAEKSGRTPVGPSAPVKHGLAKPSNPTSGAVILYDVPTAATTTIPLESPIDGHLHFSSDSAVLATVDMVGGPNQAFDVATGQPRVEVRDVPGGV